MGSNIDPMTILTDISHCYLLFCATLQILG